MSSSLFIRSQTSASPIVLNPDVRLLSALSGFRFAAYHLVCHRKRQFFITQLEVHNFRPQNRSSTSSVGSESPRFDKLQVGTIIQTVFNFGKDAVETGTNLVPDRFPRWGAKILITFVILMVALSVLKSFLSTACFILTLMGIVYMVFFALSKVV